jgi:hypothetical protein
MLREAAAMLMGIFSPAGNGGKSKRKQSARHGK